MNVQSYDQGFVPAGWIVDAGASSTAESNRLLTEHDVDEIVSISDAVLRNLLITQGYHDLKIGMARLLGNENISWVGFATWASRTAGRFIRREYVPSIVQGYMEKMDLFHRGVHAAHRTLMRLQRLRPLSRSLLVEAVERTTGVIADNVATGNRMVFHDIAPHFAGMIEAFLGATTYDQGDIDRFVERFAAGPIEEGGEDLLKDAFRAYYKAIFERDRKKKAELMLLGNNLVGYHEQSRLQDPIVNSLNAPIADLIVHTAQDRVRALTPGRMHRPLDALVDRTLRPLYNWMQREWAVVATRWLMRLELPDLTLHLGEDIPHRCEHFMFPRDLLVIENPELRVLLYQLDYTPNTTDGSAARNWGDLGDRMNYIVDFFRTRQQDSSLFRQPFTDEQIRLIREGQIPQGSL
jgi:hypothetical protein